VSTILAGRSRSRLEPLARSLDLPFRVCALDDPREVGETIRDAAVVVNSAGPFEATARPIVEACLCTGAHYLDVAGEIPIFRLLHSFDAAATRAGVMVMPGAGFVVAASDCLAAHVAGRLPDARYLRLGFSRGDRISRGSFASMLSLVDGSVAIRRDRRLRGVPVGLLERYFDYGRGDRRSTGVPWPDVFTAYYTTGIPNIEGYLEADLFVRSAYKLASFVAEPLRLAPVQSLLGLVAATLPEGPSEAERAAMPKVIVAEAEDRYRRVVTARLHTPNVYTFTYLSVVAIVERVLAGELRAGFQTPAGVYGPDFILGFAGVRREDATPPHRPDL
jgi:short subunit dehydrogenase-like uncharacterized protein